MDGNRPPALAAYDTGRVGGPIADACGSAAVLTRADVTAGEKSIVGVEFGRAGWPGPICRTACAAMPAS